ncbi:MAG: type II secretion system GspH family protein [Armatimonadetes bacterium]|nr:type II secretion system GspH family protein [Armatimonadota bacterium]MDW8154070.1 type II secretion system protein [Armatimonadota bacterium]
MCGGWRRRAVQLPAGERGLTLVEILVAIVLFGLVAVFLMYTFLAGMRFTSRANELAAATTIANQVLEQVRASVNCCPTPGCDQGVNWTALPRTPIPLPTPYHRVANIGPYRFDVEVTPLPPESDLSIVFPRVRVWRSGAPDDQPLVELVTACDDQ